MNINRTYLANKSENIEASEAHEEAPRCAEHGKAIELCEQHDVHHEASDYHEGEFCTLVYGKKVVYSSCKVKDSIFYALNRVSN